MLFRFAAHLDRFAALLAADRAGMLSATSPAMIAVVTRSSSKVNAVMVSGMAGLTGEVLDTSRKLRRRLKCDDLGEGGENLTMTVILLEPNDIETKW